MHLGETIQLYRKQNEWTQQELADKVHSTRSTIANIESGNYPSMALLDRIMQAFEVAPFEFFSRVESIKPSDAPPSLVEVKLTPEQHKILMDVLGQAGLNFD